MPKESLRITITLPPPSTPQTLNLYATLTLTNRQNIPTNLNQKKTTAYNTTKTTPQTFTFNNGSFNTFHPAHANFPAVVCLKFYQSSYLRSYKVGSVAYYIPLTEGHFNKKDCLHSISLFKDFIVTISVEWRGGSDRVSLPTTIPLMQMQDEPITITRTNSSSQDTASINNKDFTKMKQELSAFGIGATATLEDQTEVTQLFELSQSLRKLDIAVDAYRLVCFHRGFAEDAKAELIKNAQWRLTENIEELKCKTLTEILGCERSEFDVRYTSGILGISKDGSPIIVRKFGKLDMAKTGLGRLHTTTSNGNNVNESQKASTAKIIRIFNACHYWEMEWCYSLLKSQSIKHKRIIKAYVVLCFDGIGMKQFSPLTMSTIKQLVTSDSNNYPDTLRKLCIVNTPSFFSFIWRVISPYIHPTVLSKIALHGSTQIMKDEIKSFGAYSICLSPLYGGTAVPIKGVTNLSCYIPFGSDGGLPPGSVKWAYKEITSLYKSAAGIEEEEDDDEEEGNDNDNGNENDNRRMSFSSSEDESERISTFSKGGWSDDFTATQRINARVERLEMELLTLTNETEDTHAADSSRTSSSSSSLTTKEVDDDGKEEESNVFNTISAAVALNLNEVNFFLTRLFLPILVVVVVSLALNRGIL